MPRSGNVSDLLAGFQKKINLNEDASRNLRVYEAHSGKIYKELSEDSSIAPFNEYVTLYVENTPEEEINMADDERTIQAFNYDKEPSRPHGVPFKFVVKPVSFCALEKFSNGLTPSRAKYSRRRKTDFPSGPASKASSSIRSSSPWWPPNPRCFPTRDISKTVSAPGPLDMAGNAD